MNTWMDRVVDAVARALDALGLNGTRLRWKWNQKRRSMGEGGMKASAMALGDGETMATARITAPGCWAPAANTATRSPHMPDG